MTSHRRLSGAALALLLAMAGLVGLVSLASASSSVDHRALKGTIWVANRGTHTIRAFDASTGAIVDTVAMAASSQPGDLAFANGKLYVAEEFGTPPALAIVDAGARTVLARIPMATGSRPHHVHASDDGRLVAFGLYGTDLVAVVDTHDDTLFGPWDTNPATTNGRVHAGVFAPDGRTLYVASDASNEVIALDPRTGQILWRMNVPGAHELAVTRDGNFAYVSRRTLDTLSLIDLRHQTFRDLLTLGAPDTLRLAADDSLLTVGLRTMPAQVAVVNTHTLAFELVLIGPPHDTIAGHQWTSPSGRYTFAAFEGGQTQGVAVIDHRAGNQVVQTLDYPGRPHGVDRARP